jgi:hypothetical protein
MSYTVDKRYVVPELLVDEGTPRTHSGLRIRDCGEKFVLQVQRVQTVGGLVGCLCHDGGDRLTHKDNFFTREHRVLGHL